MVEGVDPATGGDVLVFAIGEGGGFLNTDDVVFEAEEGIDFLLMLVMAGDDTGVILEEEGAAGAVEGEG